mmetsp:Transcript_44928/g.108609  ORF Transcript_44928/g.108609 Transcript_44928/m.108609 type:complete len:206 (+) Transcript_44928:1325-1942(+)
MSSIYTTTPPVRIRLQLLVYLACLPHSSKGYPLRKLTTFHLPKRQVRIRLECQLQRQHRLRFLEECFYNPYFLSTLRSKPVHSTGLLIPIHGSPMPIHSMLKLNGSRDMPWLPSTTRLVGMDGRITEIGSHQRPYVRGGLASMSARTTKFSISQWKPTTWSAACLPILVYSRVLRNWHHLKTRESQARFPPRLVCSLHLLLSSWT